MITLPVGELSEAVRGRLLAGDPQASVRGVSIDSRRIAPRDCFFAIVGERLDGHDFVAAAAAAGAAGVVVHRTSDDGLPANTAVIEVSDTTAALQAFGTWLRHRLGPTVVAITGSLGKTTTKDLSATLLSRRYRVHATPENLNNHWGLPLSLLGLEQEHEVMVAELAMSHAGEIRALAHLAAPDVGVITNVAPTHMENFTDLDEVAAVKGELAGALGPTATLIVSADDPRTVSIADHFAGSLARVVTFGEASGSTVRATEVGAHQRSWKLRLKLGDAGDYDVVLNMPGRPAIANFLAAAAVAWVLDVPAADIAAAAPHLESPANRGELRQLPDDVTLLDESYNASPVAVIAALETLAGLPGDGRTIAVLGDMLELGDWAERSHRQVGNKVGELGIDLLAAVGEQAEVIAAAATDAGVASAAVHCFDSPDAAGRWLAEQLRPGDAVLVKGSRSVHMERTIAEIEPAVSDRTVEG